MQKSRIEMRWLQTPEIGHKTTNGIDNKNTGFVIRLFCSR